MSFEHPIFYLLEDLEDDLKKILTCILSSRLLAGPIPQLYSFYLAPFLRLVWTRGVYSCTRLYLCTHFWSAFLLENHPSPCWLGEWNRYLNPVLDFSKSIECFHMRTQGSPLEVWVSTSRYWDDAWKFFGTRWSACFLRPPSTKGVSFDNGNPHAVCGRSLPRMIILEGWNVWIHALNISLCV